VHPAALPVALEAAKQIGLPESKIVLVTRDPTASHPRLAEFPVLEDLIPRENVLPPVRASRKLGPGEGRRKLAFLSFSSGMELFFSSLVNH
jgi:4-coumarate--CoA ligase